MYAPQAAFFSELFGTSVRYTGASVGYQLASIFAGALAPIIAIELLGDASQRRRPTCAKVAIYMTIASVITIVAVLLAKETKATSLRHDRVLQRLSRPPASRAVVPRGRRPVGVRGRSAGQGDRDAGDAPAGAEPHEHAVVEPAGSGGAGDRDREVGRLAPARGVRRGAAPARGAR